MSKSKIYSVSASKGQHDQISFHKEDSIINIQLGHEEVPFTVKEAREIIEKLKDCIKD